MEPSVKITALCNTIEAHKHSLIHTFDANVFIHIFNKSKEWSILLKNVDTTEFSDADVEKIDKALEFLEYLGFMSDLYTIPTDNLERIMCWGLAGVAFGIGLTIGYRRIF